MSTASGSNLWPRLWVDNDLLDLARQQSYLTTRAGDGSISCKACGRYMPANETLEAHFQRHMEELERYLAGKQQVTSEKRNKNLEKARAVKAGTFDPEVWGD